MSIDIILERLRQSTPVASPRGKRREAKGEEAKGHIHVFGDPE
jgi:hypothetical protein